jgi:hypothetical protein
MGCPIFTPELVVMLVQMLIRALLEGKTDVVRVEDTAPTHPDDLEQTADQLDGVKPIRITLDLDATADELIVLM